MAKKRATWSGRITLRVPPALHEELAGLGEALGLDVNGLLRLMIARSINHYRMEAQLLMLQAQENLNLLYRWRETHPGRPVREFWEDYWQYQRAKRQKQVGDAFGAFNFDLEETATRAATAEAKEGEG